MCLSILPCVLRSQSVASVLFLLGMRFQATEEGKIQKCMGVTSVSYHLTTGGVFGRFQTLVRHAMEALTQSCPELVRGILLFNLVFVCDRLSGCTLSLL
jgi:hypothetical protein